MRTALLRITSAMCDLSPENVALLLTVGLVLGILPTYGLPTILCVLASLVRVNFPALQLVNQLSWPLQVALLVPFAKLGSFFIAPSSGVASTIAGRLSITALQAAAGWFCVCVPLGIVLYFSLLHILRRNTHWSPVVVTPI